LHALAAGRKADINRALWLTLPTTPESAASGTTAALYADTQGAHIVPGVTADKGFPAYVGI